MKTKKIIRKMFKWFNSLLLASNFGKKVFFYFFQIKLEAIEEKLNVYTSVNYKPSKSDKLISIEKKSNFNSQTAVVIQGPIGENLMFLIETIKIYRKLYPGVEIIISTWETENKESIAMLSNSNVYVVLSEMPVFNGYCNLNYQTKSSLAGILKAKELGKKFVFKTRTDCRFYKKNLINFFCLLLENYPVSERIEYQRKRIIGGGDILNSMFRPFWITDQFMFGTVEDMVNMWNYNMVPIKISTQEIKTIIANNHFSWKERIQNGYTAEPNLIIDYINRMEEVKPDCSVKRYWELIKDQFIMVSKEEVGYYWNKYDTKYNESYSNGSFYFNDSLEKCFSYNWDFISWLSLYNGELSYIEDYEKFSNDNRY